MNILVVVDMQNDFINGSLGTKEALAILPAVQKKIEQFNGEVIFTRDTHSDRYLMSKEGKHLPVEHCIQGTDGWMIQEQIFDSVGTENPKIIDKPTFGSLELATYIQNNKHFSPDVDTIELIGVCTDICVLANAILLKTYFYETDIYVDASCCAGVTVSSHENALDAMRAAQIYVI